MPSSRADDTIYCDFTINHSPVHFIFDTGAESSVLFRPTAERLGLKIIPTKKETLAPGAVHEDITEPFILGSKSQSIKTPMPVADPPPYVMQVIDGFLSWNTVVYGEDEVTLIDMASHLASTIPLPKDIGRWSKWKIIPNVSVLMFECGDGEKIGIDTGTSGGVALNPEKWKSWRTQRNGQPTTIDARVSMDGKLHLQEIQRGRKMTFGSFVLSDVLVEVEDLPSAFATYKGFDAILGRDALYRMKVIIDQQHNILYTLPNPDAPTPEPASTPYNYNRLGAVFVPQDLAQNNDLTAHVVAGSPAYQAGIRDGDVLEKIDDLDVTKWKTDPKVLPLGRFWEEPDGSTLHLFLFLRRSGQPYDVHVTLKDLPPVD